MMRIVTRLSRFASLAFAMLAPALLPAQSNGTRPSVPVVASTATNPHGPIKETCTTCHVASGWRPVKVASTFQHAPGTFPLEGAHARSSCATCHVSLEFSRTAATCASCHQDVHRGELGKQCATCHTSRSFIDRTAMARNHQTGRFPLRGAHALAACETCHVPKAPGQPQFINQPTTCIGCHASAFKATKSPDHVAASFSQDCTSCHTITTWAGAKFDHSVTRFPLTGGHATATCANCHADKVYRGKSMDCATCHQKDYDQSVTPPHKQGFPTACATCHTTVKWNGAKFDHNATAFPLLGGHKTAICADCHADKVFKGKPTTCISCHQQQYAQSTRPKHAAAGFPTTCATCHTVDNWKRSAFDHTTTRFALTGAHLTADCQSCHFDDVYRGKPMTCVSCHQKNYDATAAPPHVAAGFRTNCESCHQTVQWKGAPFDHGVTKFPLVGAHQAQACQTCHADKVYVGKPTSCVSCHDRNYSASTNPHHGAAGFVTQCESCHNQVAWKGAKYDHSKTQFPLTGAHVAQTCLACHADKVYNGKPVDCVSCHRTDYDQTKNPNHAQTGFPSTCASCHTTQQWLGAKFDHSTTAFPLTGAHNAATCTQCHVNGVYKGTPQTCVACHDANYSATTSPHHAAAGFVTQCQTCHTTKAWKPVPYDHSQTQFPLTGAHVAQACLACHADKVYNGKPTTCVSCHLTTYNATKNPPHASSGYGQSCQDCHATSGWVPSNFDHSKTAFPLTGSHKATTCVQCHQNGVYKGTPKDCYACHTSSYNASTNPHHGAAGIATTCASCHTTTAWKPVPYDHSQTQFPLTGAHVGQTCLACHADKVYNGKPTACVSCHVADYNATKNPPHASSGYAQTCQDCHTTSAWSPSNFDHSKTAFPLSGAHKATSCMQCHVNGVYKGTPTTCYACHTTDYSASTNPHHAAAGFATTCQSCHTTVAWKPVPYNHSLTSFPLTGAHLAQTCLACHSDKVYNGKPTACVSCHLTEYNATNSPPHASSGYAQTCQDCHTTSAWTPSNFDHSKTAFPLTGSHKATTCVQCHVNNVYKGTPTDCYACHTTDYSASTNPHHAAAGFATLCASCHTTTAWRPTPYDHSKTLFPLTGAHVGQACLSCHADKVYKGKPTTCITCHQTDWNATKNPPHASSGFPQTCQTCHTTGAWSPSSFNHANTAFPLTGGHNATPCLQCHVNGVYKGTPTSCYTCHTTDYSASTNPHHAAAGFATTCANCHTTSAWKPVPYNHSLTLFPLTGAHLAQTCYACHADKVYKGKPTTCVSCHLTDFTNTKNPPHGAAGFSQLCQSCHTTNVWVPSTFNHGTTAFPLTGAHTTTPCLQCHKNNVYKGTPTDCFACHTTDYNNSTNPNHKSAAFPTTCVTCHTTTQWTGATFNHDPWFRIYSGKHRGRWTSCAQCHTTPTNYKVFTCLTCHEHSQSRMDSEHQGKTGYKYDSQSCYNCHSRV